MSLASFQDLLDAARQQPEPQRLLLVFVRVELPQNATAEQRERFERREGGTLAPCLCVDKTPEEIASFEALALGALGVAVTIGLAAALSTARPGPAAA